MRIFSQAFPLPRKRGSTLLQENDSLSPVRKKKVHRVLQKLKSVPDLSDAERAVFAVSLTSTPDERWQRMQHFLHLHGSSKPWNAKKSAS